MVEIKGGDGWESIEVTLGDMSETNNGGLPVEVVILGDRIEIKAKGFGDYYSADGDGVPIFIEFYEGKLFAHYCPDINSQECETIDLSGALESRRTATIEP